MILTEKALSEEQKKAYADHLVTLDETGFVAEAAKQILDAGYSRTHCASDDRCTLCYNEAKRRDAIYLYQQGYNKAARDAGIAVDQVDIEKALKP